MAPVVSIAQSSEGSALPRALRICHVLPGPADSSNMIFAKNLIGSISETGVECHSIFLQSRTAPLLVLREVNRLQRALKQFNPDVIHAHYGTMTAVVCAISSRLPLVITYRGSDLNPCPSISLPRSVAGRVLSQLSALRARRVMCVSDGLKSRLWWKKRSVVVIPGGINLKRFRPMPRDLARSRVGWNSEEKVVIFNAGFNARGKRLDLAEAAIGAAQQWCKNMRLHILDGSEEQDRIPFYLNAADCLLMTSDWEGSPNIVKEAMACNLPVLSVDVGDVKERLAHVWPSRIVGRDPSEIGRALGEILQKPERSNGYEAVQHLSAEKVAERVVALYRELLGGS